MKKIIKTFIVGSRYFFNDLNIDRDVDLIVILKDDTSSKDMKIIKDYLFKQFKKYKKKDITYLFEKISFNDILNSVESLPNINLVKICTCLVPELAEYLDIKIEDLSKIKKYIFQLAEKNNKWKYYEVIYNSYIENNSFTLTEEQRKKAEQVYLEGKLNK